MFELETKKLEISEPLKRKMEMICRFANCKYKVKNGSIINIKGSNIAYVSPHMLISSQ